MTDALRARLYPTADVVTPEVTPVEAPMTAEERFHSYGVTR